MGQYTQKSLREGKWVRWVTRQPQGLHPTSDVDTKPQLPSLHCCDGPLSW